MAFASVWVTADVISNHEGHYDADGEYEDRRGEIAEVSIRKFLDTKRVFGLRAEFNTKPSFFYFYG